jgi:hypothetical protein
MSSSFSSATSNPGKKSKRGKAKHSSELRAKLSELTDELFSKDAVQRIYLLY